MSSEPTFAELFPHYFKDVAHLTEVDVYMLLNLFPLDDPSTALGHAVKKILVPGGRGTKSRKTDIEEAIVSLRRFLEINYGKDSPAHHEKVSGSADRDYPEYHDRPSRKGEGAVTSCNDDKPTPTAKVEVSYTESHAGEAELLRFERAYSAFAAAKELADESYAVMLSLKKEGQPEPFDFLAEGYPPEQDYSEMAERQVIADNYAEERARIHSEMMRKAGRAAIGELTETEDVAKWSAKGRLWERAYESLLADGFQINEANMALRIRALQAAKDDNQDV